MGKGAAVLLRSMTTSIVLLFVSLGCSGDDASDTTPERIESGDSALTDTADTSTPVGVPMETSDTGMASATGSTGGTGDTGGAGSTGDTGSFSDLDGDGLGDAAEVALGTDPGNPDTDGDGYLDGDEITEGKDPIDATSVIYVGGWPYLSDKSSLVDPGFGVPPSFGSPAPRIQMTDAFGDTVDTWDFVNPSTPIYLNVVAAWCLPCVDLDRWAAGEAGTVFEGLWPNVRSAVSSGDLVWITVVAEGASMGTVTPAGAADYDANYVQGRWPVLADEGGALPRWSALAAWPTGLLLNPDHTLADVGNQDPRSYLEVLDDLDPTL